MVQLLLLLLPTATDWTESTTMSRWHQSTMTVARQAGTADAVTGEVLVLLDGQIQTQEKTQTHRQTNEDRQTSTKLIVD